MNHTTMLTTDALNVLSRGLDHPEGVAWGQDGYIYAGGEAGQIYRINPQNGDYTEIARTGGFILGLCLDADNNIYACDEILHKVFRITPSGEVSIYSTGTADHPMVLPNYPVFHPSGSLYVSASGAWDAGNGCIYRIRQDGKTDIVSETNLAFVNGLAFHPEKPILYAVLSNMPGIVQFPLCEDGTLEPHQKLIDLPHTVPDGLAFDTDGNLYIACYTPDRIYCLTSSGQLNILIEDWRHVDLCSPTNIAFYGEGLKNLVIGSLGGMNLMTLQMPVMGSTLHYPHLE